MLGNHPRAFLFTVLLAVVAINAAALSSGTSASGLQAQVDTYVEPYVNGNNFSGVVLIARNGKLLVNKAYGLANRELAVANTPDTRFHIASVSKPFTAAAILFLEQRGKLSVKDPLTKYIPDYPDGDKITLHHLLTHTSGIVNANNLPEYNDKSKSPITLDQVIAMFKSKPLEFEPGSKFRYSNSNYNLLAYIIEKVSGQSYGEFLHANIFQSLDMRNTADDTGADDLILNRASGYIPVGATDVRNAPALNWSIKKGNGSLYSTAGDLYLWDRALYTDKILSVSQRKKMFTDYGGFGYGWFVRDQNGRRATIINGRSPGFTGSLQRFVDDDACVVVLANTYSGITQAMADDLASILFGQTVEGLRPAPKLPRATLDRYVGAYRFGQEFTFNPGASVRIERHEDDLLMDIGADQTFLIPQPGEKFLDRLYGGTLQFTHDSQGNVTALAWSFGRPFTATRVTKSDSNP
jgi:CubicO group peptidase (beta-lactamase class C family)